MVAWSATLVTAGSRWRRSGPRSPRVPLFEPSVITVLGVFCRIFGKILPNDDHEGPTRPRTSPTTQASPTVTVKRSPAGRPSRRARPKPHHSARSLPIAGKDVVEMQLWRRPRPGRHQFSRAVREFRRPALYGQVGVEFVL